MNEIITINTTMLDVTLLEANIGQVEGLPANPRTISSEKFNELKQSISENPEMLGLRECIVFPFDGKYIVIGGNQRFQALQELGYKSVPCKVLPADTSIHTLKAITVKDNYGYGKWDNEALVDEWLDIVEELQMSDILGMTNEELSEYMEDKEAEEEAEPGGASVEAIGAANEVLRFGKFHIEMSEDEYVWLRDTLQDYQRVNGNSYGFVNYLREKYEGQ